MPRFWHVRAGDGWIFQAPLVAMQAVKVLPSGQAGAIVRFVSASLASADLFNLAPAQLLPLGVLYTSCLEAVHVDLTTAPAGKLVQCHMCTMTA